MIRKFLALFWGDRLPEPIVCRIKRYVFLKTNKTSVVVLTVEEARVIARKLAGVCGGDDGTIPTTPPPQWEPSLYEAAMNPSAN